MKKNFIKSQTKERLYFLNAASGMKIPKSNPEKSGNEMFHSIERLVFGNKVLLLGLFLFLSTFVSSYSQTLVHKSTAVSANGAEISAFDPSTNRIFTVAGPAMEYYSLNNAGIVSGLTNLPFGFTSPGNSILPNSVAVKNGIVAVGYAIINASNAQQLGIVAFYQASSASYISHVTVGYLPDNIVFSPDGTKVLTANEGEPNSYGQGNSFDPEGSVSIIDISGGVASATVQTAGFSSFNGSIAALKAAGVRIYGPGATVAQDIEPEYISFSADGTKAFVTLQENNAVAEIDIASATVTQILPLGLKDHNVAGNGLDASDRDLAPAFSAGTINIRNWPIYGMYMPDAISSFSVGGNTYYITANEGDSRAYTGYSEEVRVSSGSYVLDPGTFPNASNLKLNQNLGRLQLSNASGDTDGDGDFDQIHALGARSFTIWNSSFVKVFDSGDQLEQITASQTPTTFNSDGTSSSFDGRSDNKGPEPEAVTVGVVNGVPYAFVGSERTGDIFVYDISNPSAPVFKQFIDRIADQGVEGLQFIAASQSPTGKALILVSAEVSRTVTVYEFEPCLAPGIASISSSGTQICIGGSAVKLFNQNSNASYTYQWLKDGVAISGANDSTYFASTSGNYRMVAYNTSGCIDTSSSIIVTTVSAASVNLSVSANAASETTGTVVTVTANASAPVCGNQTVSLGVSGTGITASDYNLSNTTISIPDGQTTGTLTFTVVNDNVVEPTETATLIISNPSAGIVLGGTTSQNISISDYVFTLQVLHASDFEAAVDAVADAPRFAAIVDTLEGKYDNTIKLSSGDNYIPGPFLSSGEDPSLAAALKTAYESYYNTTFTNPPVNLLPSIGRADISIMNFIGIEASALGNHEFDLGTTEVRNIIRGANSSASTTSWFGAQFPYLSANLNFSGDGNLSAIATTNRLLPSTAFRSNPSETVSTITNKLKLAPSTIITKGGQKIGIVGATTQVLASISSPGATTVVGGGANDMNILAGILQPVINDLIADGCNKIILLSHLQQISFEKELAGKLNGVDIIMAGGSNTLMADENDRLRAGDVAVETYPFLTTGLDGKALAIINTDGNYKYVGRLVVDFDGDGTLIPSSIDPMISGVYAADSQGVNDAWGANVGNAFAVGTRGYQVQLLCTAIGNVITVKDGNLFGKTSVFLEGRRNFVRTEETNLGNVSAEANLWMAKFYDPTTVISIKNGGGIRSAIGNVIAVGNNVTLVPPIANPSAGKQSGDISQLDIENSLRFNNQLSLVTLTASGLRSIIEHAVAATTASATPGQFAQVAGVRYSYNFSLPAGSRILNAVITDAGGNNILDTLVLNGTTYGNLARTFRVVTLNFLAGGGDSYPFGSGTNRVDLNLLPEQGPAAASFTNSGSEQDAFAEYMKNQYSTTPYGIAETPLAQDCRIQRVPTRADNVLPPNPGKNGTLTICSGTTLTTAQLFASLVGSPATGGAWSPAPAGAGVYTYTVTSQSCAGSASAMVSVTVNATSSSSQSRTICSNELPYSWDGLTFNAAGTQTKTGLMNAVGCDSSAAYNLTVKATTSSNGSITVCPSALPYNFNGQIFTTDGTKTAILTNAAGCDSIATLTVTVLRALTSTTTSTNATCFGTATGSLTVTSVSGAAPFLYRLGSVGNYVSANTFNNLRAGSYRVFLQDANGCTGVTNAIVLTQPVAVTGTSTSTPATCFGTATGSLTVNPTTGTSPYTYRLGSAGTFTTSNTFSGLRASGFYRITIKDNAGCEGVIAPLAVTQPTQTTLSATKTDETCPGAKDGSITVNGTGGTAPYTYRFGGSGVFSSTNTFTNLKAGKYSVFVRDANGCNGATASVTIIQTSTTCLTSGLAKATRSDVESNKAILSPNPTRGNFKLTLPAMDKSVTIRVTDLNGKMVYSNKANSNQSLNFGEAFAPGIYQVEIMNGSEVKTLKAVKLR